MLIEIWIRKETTQGEENVCSLLIHKIIQADYTSRFKKTNSHASGDASGIDRDVHFTSCNGTAVNIGESEENGCQVSD